MQIKQTKEQIEADKTTLKILEASYKAVECITKQTKKKLKYNIAALKREENSLRDKYKTKAREVHNNAEICGPEYINTDTTINDLNKLFHLWQAVRYSLIILERGY